MTEKGPLAHRYEGRRGTQRPKRRVREVPASQTSGSPSLRCGKSGLPAMIKEEHPSAFLPKPCITEKQFSDLFSYPHSPSREMKAREQIQKLQQSSVGYPFLYPHLRLSFP